MLHFEVLGTPYLCCNKIKVILMMLSVTYSVSLCIIFLNIVILKIVLNQLKFCHWLIFTYLFERGAHVQFNWRKNYLDLHLQRHYQYVESDHNWCLSVVFYLFFMSNSPFLLSSWFHDFIIFVGWISIQKQWYALTLQVTCTANNMQPCLLVEIIANLWTNPNLVPVSSTTATN